MSKENQRDQHYKNRTIRIADEVWELFKDVRRRSGKTWNLFIKAMVNERKNYEQKKNN